MEIVGKGNGSELVSTLPAAPRYFDPIAKKQFKNLGKVLITSGLLKRRHIPTLEILAQNFAQWEYAVKEINRKNRKKKMSGFIQTFQNNTTNISPEVTLKEKAEKQIFICLKRFGLDPKSEKELDASQLSLPLDLDNILKTG